MCELCNIEYTLHFYWHIFDITWPTHSIISNMVINLPYITDISFLKTQIGHNIEYGDELAIYDKFIAIFDIRWWISCKSWLHIIQSYGFAATDKIEFTGPLAQKSNNWYYATKWPCKLEYLNTIPIFDILPAASFKYANIWI